MCIRGRFQAWDRRRLDELRDLLGRYIPREGVTDIRGTEWHLLSALAQPPEPALFLGHDGPVREIAMVPGREEFVSVGDDGTIRHWSIRERKLLRTIDSGSDQLHAVAVSPDGRWLATGNPTLQLWDFASGEKIRDLTSADVTLESVAFAPDGESIAAGWRYDEVRVVSLDGELRAHLQPTGLRNETLVFSRDGSALFVPFKSDADFVIRRWQVGSPGEWTDLGKGTPTWDRVAVTFDDAVSAAVPYSSSSVFFIDNSTGQVIGELGTGSETVRAVGFSPRSDRIAFGSDDGMLNFAPLKYGWQTGGTSALMHTRTRTVSAHSRKITDLEYLSGERILTCSEDGSIKLWDLSQSQISVRMDVPAPGDDVAISPNGEQIIVPCGHGRIWLGDTVDGRESSSAEIGEQDLTHIAVYPDGSRVLVSDDRGRILVWDRRKRRVVAEWRNPKSSTIWDMAVSPEGDQIASAAADQLLRFHDAESLSIVDTVGASDNVLAVAYAPDGHRFAWGGEFNDVYLCEPGRWADAKRITTRSDCLCIAFANHSNLFASGHRNGFIRFMDTNDGHTLHLRSSSSTLCSLAWSRDDRLLISTHGDGTLRVWHVPTATELGVLYRGGMMFSTTCISPDGNRLAAIFSLKDASQAILWKLAD